LPIREPNPDPDAESTSARIIDDLLQGAEEVDEGVFTLDPVAAAAKLEAFAYADRTRHLLPIVEGLFGLGAREVAVETRGEDLVIRGNGIRLHDPEGCFVEIYSHAIGVGADPRARALGRLGIGIDMILGGDTAANRVELRYSGTSTAVIAEYRFRAAPQLREDTLRVVGELEILVDHPWIRMGSDGRRESLAHLRDAARFSDRKISLDKEPISGRTRNWFETMRGEGPGYRFSAGLEQVGERSSEIELWTAGLCIGRVPGEGLAFRAVIELDAPRRDLSQLEVVRDETVEQALAAVEQARLEALGQLERADASWTDATRPAAWPEARVDRTLDRAVRERPPPKVPRVAAAEPLGALSLFFKIDKSPLARVALVLAIFTFGVGPLFIQFGVYGLRHELPSAKLLMIGLVMLGTGVALILPTVAMVRQASRARDRGVQVRAKITGIEAAFDPNNDQGRLLWSFTDAAGIERTGRSLRRRSAELESWLPDGGIVVYYDPEQPEDSWWEADVGPAS
jgi:hypothetical protein